MQRGHRQRRRQHRPNNASGESVAAKVVQEAVGVGAHRGVGVDGNPLEGQALLSEHGALLRHQPLHAFGDQATAARELHLLGAPLERHVERDRQVVAPGGLQEPEVEEVDNLLLARRQL
eukprot:12097815-Alexandrium_andersonii.AAC.1